MHLPRPFRRASAAATVPAPASGSVDQYTIAHRFNADHDYDYFCVSVRVDPNELWAEDWDGDLWVIPYSTDGADEITWGEFERSRLVAVPVEAAAGVQATELVSRTRQRVLASFTRPETRPDPTSRQTTAAAAATTPEEASSMTDEQRRTLAAAYGLNPDEATEDQIMQSAQAAADARQPEEEPEPTPEPEVTPEVEPELVTAAVQIRSTLGLPASASDDDVARAAEELRNGAAAGARVAREQETRDLDQAVDAAVSDGRIPPSARDSWRAAIDPGEQPDTAASARAQRERDALAALPANRVPVRERGANPSASQDKSSLNRALAASGIKTENKEEVIRRG